MSRKIAHVLLLLGTLTIGANAEAKCTSSERQSIEIFKYRGTATKESEGLFDAIRGVIEGVLGDLVLQMQSDPETSYIKKIDLVENAAPGKGPADLAIIWKENHRFLLMSGTILPAPGPNQFAAVDSRIYLGELHGSLQSETINFRYSYISTDVRDFTMIITTIIDYVLAMDAKAAGCAAASKIITFAQGAASQIPLGDPGLLSLKQAVSLESSTR
jgi:hypothetical protein